MNSVQACQLNLQKCQKLIRLVRERCLIKCAMNSLPTNALWDTGAQVSVVTEEWWRDRLPEVPLQVVEDLIERELKVAAANQAEMPYIGWIQIELQLTAKSPTISVPFLVSTDDLREPIIGSNVIGEVMEAVTLIIWFFRFRY